MPASTSRAVAGGPWRVRRARVSGCASAPAALVVEAGEAPTAAPVHDGEWDAAWSVPRGQPGSSSSRAGVVDRRRSPRTSRTVADALRRGDRDRRAASSSEVRAAARRPWRRRVPDRPQVAGGCGARIDAALPRRQRRRERAGHVQGSSGDRERSVLGRRGHDDRGFATGCERSYLYLRRVPHRVAADGERSTPHERPATSATTSSGGVRFDIEMRKGAARHLR